jgi:prokaryotic ubiquitin-like protein Pup
VGETQEVVMAGQERVNTRRDDEEPADDAAPAPATPAAQARDADVDALLDEIDDVLESNAEQFVRGFVQKGGQ